MNNRNWYAIKATYGRALQAKDMLSKLSIDSYIPMEANTITIKGKKVTKIVPVFTNLIFICTEEETIRGLVRDNEYLHYIYDKADGKYTPSVVPVEEMNKFISFVENREIELTKVNYEDINFSVGEKVRVTEGSFIGKEAILTKIRGKRSKQVVVTLGNYLAMSIEINPIYLERISE